MEINEAGVDFELDYYFSLLSLFEVTGLSSIEDFLDILFCLHGKVGQESVSDK
jgi:hypothetical protein